MAGYPKPTTEIPTMPPRPAAMHKGLAGKVAIIAGSRGMSGAAVLCGQGALRGGAGLVRVYTPASVQPIVAASEPCLMTVPVDDRKKGRIGKNSLAELFEAGKWANVMALGPGLGTGAQVEICVWGLVQTTGIPMVLDADGLNGLAAHAEGRGALYAALCNRQAAPTPAQSPSVKPPLILTPHPGEMQRLRHAAGLTDVEIESGDESRLNIAFEFAVASNTIVVLKGHRTVVASAERTFINTTGNPGMATGGMGDVLTGLIAALIAQGMSAFDAACLAVHIHGAAADTLARRIAPFGYLAREVADELPATLTRTGGDPVGFR